MFNIWLGFRYATPNPLIRVNRYGIALSGAAPNKLKIKNARKIIINKKKSTLAILVAVDAIPRNQNKPATMATIKKISAHLNITISLSGKMPFLSIDEKLVSFR